MVTGQELVVMNTNSDEIRTAAVDYIQDLGYDLR
jgi:hypothetical protein